MRRKGGVVRVSLDDPEIVLLASLVAQVRQVLGGDEVAAADPMEALLTLPSAEVATPDDPILARLLPDAYRDDDAAAGEFRRLMDGELRAQKCAALQRVLDDLADGGRRKGDEHRLELDDVAAEQWLYAINDVRLSLGTALDITEDMYDTLPGLDPDDPRYLQLGVYDWVTWLQDAIVRAVSD
ncbi:MAG: DUF2017 domain-containing protein [Mycobacteriales bacterium]